MSGTGTRDSVAGESFAGLAAVGQPARAVRLLPGTGGDRP